MMNSFYLSWVLLPVLRLTAPVTVAVAVVEAAVGVFESAVLAKRWSALTKTTKMMKMMMMLVWKSMLALVCHLQ